MPSRSSHRAELVARCDLVAGLGGRHEGPAPRAIERRRHRAGGKEVPLLLGEATQRAPGAVEHRAEQSGAELGHERRAGGLHRLLEREAGRVLEDLDGGGLAVDPDHFAEQASVAHPHDLVERRARHRRRLHQRAGGADDPGAGHRSLTR